LADFIEVPLLVAVTDFLRYTAQASRLGDLDVARVMSDYYELAGSRITAGGGRVVKFIGDAMLAVFPSDGVDRGVLALLDLKDAADRFMAEHGWECRLEVKAHFGTVAVGELGSGQDKRYDVLGKVVNAAFRLKGVDGIALSPEALERLGPGVQARLVGSAPRS
jgi:adenylate cyclase